MILNITASSACDPSPLMENWSGGKGGRLQTRRVSLGNWQQVLVSHSLSIWHFLKLTSHPSCFPNKTCSQVRGGSSPVSFWMTEPWQPRLHLSHDHMNRGSINLFWKNKKAETVCSYSFIHSSPIQPRSPKRTCYKERAYFILSAWPVKTHRKGSHKQLKERGLRRKQPFLQSCENINFCSLSHLVCVTWLWPPWCSLAGTALGHFTSVIHKCVLRTGWHLSTVGVWLWTGDHVWTGRAEL
jgi:hypothetical protein